MRIIPLSERSKGNNTKQLNAVLDAYGRCHQRWDPTGQLSEIKPSESNQPGGESSQSRLLWSEEMVDALIDTLYDTHPNLRNQPKVFVRCLKNAKNGEKQIHLEHSI